MTPAQNDPNTTANKTARRILLALIIAAVVIIGWGIGSNYANPKMPLPAELNDPYFNPDHYTNDPYFAERYKAYYESRNKR